MPKTGLLPDEIKKLILRTSELEIQKYGVEKFRLTEIARKIGISHAALYIHFKDKESILSAIIAEWLKSLDSSLETICKSKKKPNEKILDWFLFLHQEKKNKKNLEPNLFQAFSTLANKENDCIRHHLQTSNQQLTELLTEFKKQFPKSKKKKIAEMVQILFLGTLSFHHPKMMNESLQTEGEKSLKEIVLVILDGLKQ